MANLIITNDGQTKITNAILNNTSVFPKYFKVSSTDYTLDPALTDIDGWITKDINSWLVVDNNTVMITCVVEAYEATNECVTIGIYDIDNTLLFVGKPSSPYPAGTRQIITFDILLTNINQVLDFSYLPWNDSEVYLLINQISSQNANEFIEVYQKISDLSIKYNELRLDVDNILNSAIINAATVEGYTVSNNADPNTIVVRDSTGAITISPANSANQAVTLQQADDRYVNVTGDTIEGTLSVIGELLKNNSPVVTVDNLTYDPDIDIVFTTAQTTYDLTLPTAGTWLIFTTGVVTCGLNNSWTRLYANGTVISSSYMTTWPGNAPVTHVGLVTTTVDNQVVNLSLECADMYHVKVIKIYPLYIT